MDKQLLILTICVKQYTFIPAPNIEYYTCKGELYVIGRQCWFDVEEKIALVKYDYNFKF